MTRRYKIFFALMFGGYTAGWGQSALDRHFLSGGQGMVVASSPFASEAGIVSLKAGGNAYDAAVATAFALAVVEPAMSGLGGGGGVVAYVADADSFIFMNFYAQSSENIWLDYQSDLDGSTARALLIPGAVAGYLLLHELYGTLPLKRLLAPAIKLAREGFPIDPIMGIYMTRNEKKLNRYPETSSIYFHEDGALKGAGEILVQPELANTLESISEGGRGAFYEGEFADSLAAAVNAAGGRMTLADLRSYQPVISAPVKGNYRGYEIYSAAPAQSGVLLIQMLHMLENYSFDMKKHFTTDAGMTHVAIEVMKRAYADRAFYLADPSQAETPVAQLIDKKYTRSRFREINKKKADPVDPNETRYGMPKGVIVPQQEASFSVPMETYANDESEMGETSHFSIVDSEGNMVSVTTTLGSLFGSSFMHKGVLFNNAMSNFSKTGERYQNANRPEPRLRPRTTIMPTIMVGSNGEALIIGAAGGGRIPSTLIQVITGIIDLQMSVKEALQSPRFYARKRIDAFDFESGFTGKTVAGLRSMGHPIDTQHAYYELFFGRVHMIFRDPNGVLHGGADPRTMGEPRRH